jgi:hypothetical protein
MDFQFNTLKENTITILETNNDNAYFPITTNNKIWTNRIHSKYHRVSGENVSRRHCVIINSKDNIWLYDLDSTGTYK